MPILPEDRYKQMFEHWHFASEIRFKILTAWWAVYVGLAAVFGWLWSGETFKPISFVVPLIGLIATVLFWFMDDRNGGAIYASQKIIEALEKELGIPNELQIVWRSNHRDVECPTAVTGMRHYQAINIFAGVMSVLLLVATIYLFCRCRSF